MEIIKKKRIREKPGQVVRIPLKKDVFGYGQLADPYTVFFNYTDDGLNTDIQSVVKQPIAFEIAVDKYAIEDGLWEVLGVLPVNPYFMRSKKAFSSNSDSRVYPYFIWEKGKERVPCKPEDIKELEMIASWGHRSAEQRLLDYIEGRPNYDFERMHNKHNPNFPKTRKEFYAQYNYVVKEDEEEKKRGRFN